MTTNQQTSAPLTVTLSQASTILRCLWDIDPHLPVMLWGGSGAGKSALVESLVADPTRTIRSLLESGKRPGYRVLRSHALNPAELHGVLVPMGDKADWLPLGVLPDPATGDPAAGILFLDEINLAPPSVQGELMQLVYDRRVGAYDLPDSWHVIAAGNRASDKGAVQQMPSPLKRRFLHLHITPDLDEFTAWALRGPAPAPSLPAPRPESERQRVHHRVMAFLRWRPQLLMQPPARTEGAEACPRTWEYASKLVYSPHLRANCDLLLPAMAGCVGEGPAAEFVGFLKVADRTPDLDEILAGKDHLPPAQGNRDRPAILHAMCAGLVARYTTPPKAIVKAAGGKAQAREQIAARLLDYSRKHMSREFAVVLIKDAVHVDSPPVLDSPAFEAWAREFEGVII